MLGTLLGSAAKSAARAAANRTRTRNELLRAAGYKCPSCGSTDSPTLQAPHEKMTLSSWFFRGGLMGMWWRKLTNSGLACPQCRTRTDLHRWLGAKAADYS